MTWQLDERDGNQLDMLFDLALTGGPQEVRRGDEEIVILSLDDYERLGGKKPRFDEHLTSTPTAGETDLVRDQGVRMDANLDG